MPIQSRPVLAKTEMLPGMIDSANEYFGPRNLIVSTRACSRGFSGCGNVFAIAECVQRGIGLGLDLFTAARVVSSTQTRCAAP